MTTRVRLGAFSLMLVSSAACEPVTTVEPALAPAATASPPAAPGSLVVAAPEPPAAPVAPVFLRCDGPKVRSGDTLFCLQETPLPWQEAEQQCQRAGGHLAHLASAAEANGIQAAFGAPFDLPPWMLIGLVEPFREGEWSWMTGKRVTFQNWYPGEPNDQGGEDCGELHTISATWNDVDCRVAKSFLCEGPPASASGKSTFKCTGTLIQAGPIPYCAHTDQSLAAAAAEAFCKAAGGHLAELSTAEKNAALLAAIRPRVGDGNDLWLGLSDAHGEGEWRTASGEPVTFTAWRAGEPNNAGDEDCAAWGPRDGEWNDLPCSTRAQSICRGRAEPAPLVCDGPLPFTTAGCTNLARGDVRVSASATWKENGPEKAADGDCTTGWNAGGGPQQHWQIDLGAAQEIRGVSVAPDMSPQAGAVAHDVAVSTDGSVFRVVLRYDGPMAHGQVVPLDFGVPVKARYVRVTTTASPSWVAWKEIGVFACP